MKNFIGREAEIARLSDLLALERSSLAVIKGRRRIGKSSLAVHFATTTKQHFFQFSGLAPINKITAQDQRDHFGRQLALHCNLPPLTFSDWNDAFNNLTTHIPKERTVILLDEISWLGSKDATFLPKLKVWWDLTIQQHDNIILILCGSVSTWIETNIINSTAFFGRISLTIDLTELTLTKSHQLLLANKFKGSVYDIFKILAITGGIPWYIEQIAPHYTADQNIQRLCFSKDAVLVQEFSKIFNDLFDKKGDIYQKIINILSVGMRDLSQLRQALEYSRSGTLSKYLANLITSGFVSKHCSWSLKTGALAKQSLYRLSDNYLRFYLKYIATNLPQIAKNSYQDFSVTNLPGWPAMLGFQVESLILKNRKLLLESLGITPSEIVADDPYIQRPTTIRRGCQIDYLIQTRSNNLFVCEFKFKKREIGTEIISEMQDKIARFVVPKGFGVCPVLVHLGGVTDCVYDAKYFYRIIDLADFLCQTTSG